MEKAKKKGFVLKRVNLKSFRKSFVFFKDDVKRFSSELWKYIYKNLHLSFIHFESGKKLFATALYRQRGKLARRFVHTGMVGLAALGIMIAPIIAEEFPGRGVDPWEIPSPSTVLSAATESPYTQTLVSEKVRDRIVEYEVKDGDTISSIAEKFDVTEDTIYWQNDLTSRSKITPGQVIEVLPVTGIAHKVRKGDTVYSIAKRYDIDPQPIVNYPFNTFTNDETFELAIGQTLMVPEGIMPQAQPTTPRVRQLTPDAGTVVASGSFVWPAGGRVTQRFVWYHKALDIANKAAPNILAADSGTVVVAGWPDGYGYGNRVVIDHGNGYKTLYGHLSRIYVVPGQTVARGAPIGKMGSTGRSTGIHLHFEVIDNGVYLNPLSVLQ
ncbi:MAG: peptidoglycan DD-metalloendopeptidase family protein [Candidatus Woesebacteria bacterium]|jgi:murein DD-endopeptidase MepM/ murein hydrolase activator NlpD